MKTNKTTTNLSVLSPERLELNNDLTVLISDMLNKIHGKNFSVRFWKILVSPYVSAIINSYDIFQKSALIQLPTMEVFANHIQNRNSLKYELIRYKLKAYRNYRGLKSIDKQLKKNNQLAIGFFNKIEAISSIETFIKPYYPFIHKKEVDYDRRQNITKMFIEDENAMFIANIINQLPMFYVEYFDDIYNSIDMYNPEDKIFHVAVLENFYSRMIVSKYIEHGAKLHYYQHGGFYGEYEYHNAHHNESDISDKFITWGWKMLEKDEAGKAYRCEKFRQEYKLRNKKKYDLLIIFPTINKHTYQKLKELTDVFFAKVNKEKFPIICARPRPTMKFNRKRDLDFIKTQLNYIDKAYKPASEVISNSKLVVQLSYPSTNMLECFYVDHPTVAILNNHNPSKIVLPYYEFFLSKGVFHLNMESLVNHINNINIDEWWYEIIQNSVYLSFKEDFINKV